MGPVLTTPDEQMFHGGVAQPDGSLVLAEVFNTVGNPYSRVVSSAGGIDVKLNKLQQLLNKMQCQLLKLRCLIVCHLVSLLLEQNQMVVCLEHLVEVAMDLNILHRVQHS